MWEFNGMNTIPGRHASIKIIKEHELYTLMFLLLSILRLRAPLHIKVARVDIERMCPRSSWQTVGLGILPCICQ
jgi:hypothetical protein